MVSSGRKPSRLPFDYYHRRVSLEDATVGFLSQTIASYTSFDEATRKRRDDIFAEGRQKKKKERSVRSIGATD